MFSLSKINNPRLLLAQVREGDFAHAGDREAIDIVLKKVFELIEDGAKSSIKVLDVGCGLGGTAAYIKDATSFDIDGIDIDPVAIKHAKSKYNKIRFFECDANNADKKFPEDHFEIIYLFNVFYAIPNQKDSLKTLAAVAKPGALLVIFDYSQNKSASDFELKDLSGKSMRPVNLTLIKDWLVDSGWELIEITDLSVKYEIWYKEFLVKLDAEKEKLLKIFSEEAFSAVYNTFSVLLDSLRSKKISGSVVYARLNKSGLGKPKSKF